MILSPLGDVNTREDARPSGMDPIRSEIFSAEHLQAYAAELAGLHKSASARSRRRGVPLLRRVEENGEALREAHRIITRAILADRSVTPAAEWLADNFYVVNVQLREIRNHLPPSYYRDLPKLTQGAFTGYPRVYAIICAYIAHTDSRLDAELLARFLQAYQRVQPLTIGELWAVAITLRVALTENLRRLADQMVGGRDARKKADRVADMLLNLRSQDAGSIAVTPEDWERSGDSPFFTAFAAQLFQRLQDQAPPHAAPLDWMDAELSRQGISAQEIIRQEHQKLAASNISVRNIITSMRLVLELDWKEFFESVSMVETVFRASPGYSEMDFASRDLYRHAVENLSRSSGKDELRVATMAVESIGQGEADDPREVGYSLIGCGRREFERGLGYRSEAREAIRRFFKAGGIWFYAGGIMAIALLFAIAGLRSLADAGLPWAAVIVPVLLALAPYSEGALALMNRIASDLSAARILPKMDFTKGIPAFSRTLVAVPSMLRDKAEVGDLIERLEVHFLANPDGDIRFALLSDWVDAPSEKMPGDEDLLAAAVAGVADLNARYAPLPDGGARFLLLHRRRTWNARDRVWMGWERKRGKLSELNRLLRGERELGFILSPDDLGRVPSGVKYVITLDVDTRLPKGAAARLAGCMAHPLNRPHFDAGKGRVTAGYGIMQPRVVPALPERGRGTFFHWVTAGECGIDPYASAISDVYQDLFGEGSFTGKGIYDVDAFEHSLRGRIPENAMLSHDLFEGVFARAGLVTDIEVLEDFPSHYQASTLRQHRWARGDWQLLPWILGSRGKGLPFLGRWKMADNLRRSLVAPCAFFSLALAWLMAPQPPVAWTAILLLALAMPFFVAAHGAILSYRSGFSLRSYLRDVEAALLQALSHYLLSIVLLAHQAWLMSDAILRTGLRLCFGRGSMLQWIAAAVAATRVHFRLPGIYRDMAGAVVLPAALLAGMFLLGRIGNLPIAAPLLALWLLSPAAALFASTPRKIRRGGMLSPEESVFLRLTALKTWRFFRDFVNEGENNLPPDNFQEDPQPVVAHRTSPTNMGLCLLSIATARDLGWLGLAETAQRLEGVLGSMGKLERYRGHFFNWYATRDARPLEPRYISTVDSGNLAGHLLALKRSCLEYMDASILSPSLEAGLADLFGLVKEAVRALPENMRAQAFGREHLLEALLALESLVIPVPVESDEWTARVSAWDAQSGSVVDLARSMAMDQKDPAFKELLGCAEFLRATLGGILRDIDAYSPWLLARSDWDALQPLPIPETRHLLDGRPSLRELESRCLAAAAELRGLPPAVQGEHEGYADTLILAGRFADGLIRSAREARAMLDRLGTLSVTAERLGLDMDFGFLEDPHRKLFSIGFRVREEQLDPGFYDLLASEARLTSFLAVAKGDVPPSHWFRLGRTLTPVGRGATLLSWSGSMFEYLMPSLVMRPPEGSLLDVACRYAVERQMEYGRDNGIPWGISEAAYSIRDLEMTYQYSSFGVPGLGLKRGLGTDLVVAPYATGLAAMIAPRSAAENLLRLRSEGAEGKYGFYDAVDYTKARLQEGSRATVVKSYFAHHQGMMLVALGDVLLGGRMRERFHSEPIIQAVDPLLQERLPKGVAIAEPNTEEAERPLPVANLIEPVLHRFNTPHEPIPRTHILSNGRYTVLITAAGSGFSRWQGQAITRWREDAVMDAYGQYFYLRDTESGHTWSAAFQPMGREPDSYSAVFAEDRVEITRRDGSLTATLEIVISPEDDAEVRRLTLENTGYRDREVEVTSYCEVVMAPQEADLAHPAFSNLFVQTEFIPGLGALLATRRPRSAGESPSWAAHVCGVEGQAVGGIQYETDRARFLGRGRTVRRPVSVVDGKPLSNTAGAVLDPVFSLRRRVRVPADGKVRISFTTLAAETREKALALADKYRETESFQRVATLAWTQAQIQLKHLGIGPDEARLYQRLANRLYYTDAALRPSPDLLAMNRKGQEGLWAFGISGDLPIVLAGFDEGGDRNLARDLLKAHAYWEMKRVDVDLVMLNENPSESYLQSQQNELEGLLRMRHAGQATRGGVFLLRRDAIQKEQLLLLQASARAVLGSRRGSLADQVMRMRRNTAPTAPVPAKARAAKTSAASPVLPALEFFNGLGGFASDGKEYHIILGDGQWTPAPWINVIANPDFGFLVSESGSGFTWCGNSREAKLTPWFNDPVSDPGGEAVYLRDRDTGAVWSPTALPIREEGQPYVVIHGQGYSRFTHESHGIRQELTQWVPWEDPIKISRLILENTSDQPRRLDATFYVEWVLGAARGPSTQQVQTKSDAATGALFAGNTWSAEFAGRVAFADLQGRQSSFTCDRAEFLGRNGDRAAPAALFKPEPLSNRAGAGMDPCSALQCALVIPPYGKTEIVFTLGQASRESAASDLVRKYRAVDFAKSWQDVKEKWDALLGGVRIRTPDRSLDLLLNRWLPYQTIACRLWARSGFYQAGGAYGFRDQLQDAMAFTVLDPGPAREQIIRASGRQFHAGDVQHWWHPPSGRGVRTHFSDDRIWLIYAVLHYLESTGDVGVLDQETPFLEGPDIPPGKEDAYFHPETSSESASVYEHCSRALDRSLAVGSHGLPLMGSGDWNDGMNRVGQSGKGESGWLAWFLIPNLKGFADIAESRGHRERAAAWREKAEQIRLAMESQGWDGDWYRRGYFDDGTPLGSSQSRECRIDSIAQSWAVLSGAADPSRARQAMISVEEYLVKREEELILLFTPPFDVSNADPGYIKGYLPGVRENGGQYTHAAVWVVAAFAALGEGNKAAELFSLLNPVNHAGTRAGALRYKVEPYAAAADVYAVSPHVGRGGWTWYTGSAGWMYRAGLEWMLGLRISGKRLTLRPCIPRDWRRFEIKLRRGASEYEITVLNPNGHTRGIEACQVDGVTLERVPASYGLDDDGKTHYIRVTMGEPRSGSEGGVNL